MRRSWKWFVIAAGSGLVIGILYWFRLSDNYHAVIPGTLYRSRQLTVANLLAHAAQDHLATVINLRPETNETWHLQEITACTRQKITYLDFPLAGNQSPSYETMTALVAIMRTAPRPILIHCEHGADRTGLAVALYLRAIAGLPAAEAKAALALCYGHTRWIGMDCFDRAFAEYCQKEASKK